MKFLIYSISLIVFTTLNVLLGYATGFKVGSVLFYVIWYYSAKAMCKAWEKSNITKKASKVGLSAFEYIRKDIPKDILDHCENIRGNYDTLKADLKQFAKDGNISKAYADIVLEEYMQKHKPTSEPVSVPVVEASIKESKPTVLENSNNQTQFCRKCGNRLIDGSRFCRKCGTEVVEVSEL